jgi:hypothetical protein
MSRDGLSFLSGEVTLPFVTLRHSGLNGEENR